MKNKEKLYESFGELIYVVAMADGTIQKEELEVIEKKLSLHPWGKEIKWSFDYEVEKRGDMEALYEKVIAHCETLGPDREYEFLIEVLEDVARASDGIDENEEAVINAVKDLAKRFRGEIDRINTGETSSPPLLYLLLEGRTLFEWPSMYFMYHFLPKRVEGEGHPVLLLPPFLGTDTSTSFIRKFLKQQGFKAYKWDIGRNYVRSAHIRSLEKRLNKIFEEHDEKVSLVGWSGGGMFAKILANRNPEKIAQIITIGSPVWGLKGMSSHADLFYEITRGKGKIDGNEDFIHLVEDIPPVPVTCIYTKTDGIVPWRYCCEAESKRDDIQNIEVVGSHCGLGANPAVLLCVANVLKKRSQGQFLREISGKYEKVLFPGFWKEKIGNISKGIFSRFHFD
jgi:uncharacterized tellurite resistance protein B-like protein